MTLSVHLLTEAGEWGPSGWLCTVEVFWRMCCAVSFCIPFHFSPLHSDLLVCIILYISSFLALKERFTELYLSVTFFSHPGEEWTDLYHSVSFFFSLIRRGIYWTLSFCILLLFLHHEKDLLNCIILYLSSFPPLGEGFTELDHSVSFFFPPSGEVFTDLYHFVSFFFPPIVEGFTGLYHSVSFFFLP